MVKANINFTLSKIGAFVVLFGAIAYGMAYRDETVMVTGFAIGGGLLGWKQHDEASVKKKELSR